MTVKELRPLLRPEQETYIVKYNRNTKGFGHSEVIFEGNTMEMPIELADLEIYRMFAGAEGVLTLYVKEA